MRPHNGERARITYIIYSQNVHNLLRAQKIVLPLESKERDHSQSSTFQSRRFKIIKQLQDMWDKKDWVKKHKGGYIIFHKNNDIKQSRTGVAIILSPRYCKAWKTAGGLDPIQTPTGNL
jgi:hypothetical protein